PNAFTLLTSGGNLHLLDNGVLVDNRPLSAVTNYTVTGGSAADSLTIDLSGGPIAVKGAILFQAGGGSDAFGIRGGNLFDLSVDHYGTNGASFAFTPIGGSLQFFKVFNNEMIDLTGVAADMYLNLALTKGDDQATLVDSGPGKG